MPLLVLALTDSPAWAGLIAAARSAPYVVLGLPAGALIDRWNRRMVLIACEVTRGLAIGSVALAWWLGVLTIWHLVAVALVQGVAVAFANVAQTASLPRLVRRDQIQAAQAMNASTMGVASLIGPGLGGLIVALGSSTTEGAALAFVADAATAALASSMLSTIRRPFQGTREGGARRLREDIVEGLRYLWEDRAIRLLAIVNCVHRLCLGPVVVLAVVVFGRNVLHADASAIGLIVGAAGAGGLLGAAITPTLRRYMSIGWMMVAIVALHGSGIVIVGLAPGVPVAMVGMLIVGVGEAATGIVQVSYRLVTIPDVLQGRVNSVYRMGSFVAQTLGATIAGVMVESIGPREALWAMGAYVLVIAAGVARSDVRKL
jgi:MFS family permease